MDIDTWPSWASVCLSFIIIGGITFFQLAKCWFGRTKNYEPEKRPTSGSNKAKQYIDQHKNGTIANGHIRRQQKHKTSKTKQQTGKDSTSGTRSYAARVTSQHKKDYVSASFQTDTKVNTTTSAKEEFPHSKKLFTARGNDDTVIPTKPAPSTSSNPLTSNDTRSILPSPSVPWITVLPEKMSQKQNNKKKKEQKQLEKLKRDLEILDVKERLKHIVASSSGEYGDVSSEDNMYKERGRKKKKAGKQHKRTLSSAIASPRIPTVEPKKQDRIFSFRVNEEGAQVKFPTAYLFLPPNAVGSDTNLKVSICNTQRKRRDDKNFRFLTPAFHIWKVDSQSGQMTDYSMMFFRKVFVKIALLSCQTDEPNAKIQKTDNIKNVDWKYFAETNCSSRMQFVGFSINRLGGYRAIATPDLVPLNYILYVRRPEQHQDPDEHEFILKFWSIDIKNRDKLEVVLQEQVVNAHYGSTLTFTLSGKNVARERMEFTLPHAKQRVIKRSFSMKLKKTDSWQLTEDHKMNLTCVLSSPYIETLTNPCDFQWTKKPQQTSIEVLGPGAIGMQVNNHFHGDRRSSVQNAQQQR